VLLIGLLIVSAGSFLLASSRIVQAFTAGESAASSTETGGSPSPDGSRSGVSKDAVDQGERGSRVSTQT
jgi:hypothetical protein